MVMGDRLPGGLEFLDRAGVELYGVIQPLLRCRTCRKGWAPLLRGVPREGWWRCPGGCNKATAEPDGANVQRSTPALDPRFFRC
jgi:hypothetical protein